MAFLLKWLNGTPGRQPSGPVTHLEKDFASGLRFCELLVFEKAMPADTLDRMRGRHPLEVLDEVCAAMDTLCCTYKKEVVGKVIEGRRGGASALLMSIKAALEARDSDVPPVAPQQPSTRSVRPKEFERPELDDWGRDDFFQRTYEKFNVHEFKNIDMAVHLRRFHDEQRELERRQTTAEDITAAAAQEKREDTYALKIRRDHERATFLRAKLDVAEQHWRDSRVAIIEAERSELRYEVTLQRRHYVRTDIHRFMLTREVDSYIDGFEKNMKRLGIGGSDGPAPGGKVMSTAAESALAYLERIEQAERNAAMTPQEAQEMITDLRAKAKASRVARMERERRRRKMVVDQASAARELFSERARGELLGGLLDEGKRQRSTASKRWEANYRSLSKKKRRALESEALQCAGDAALDVAIDRLVDEARTADVESAALRAAHIEKLGLESLHCQQRRTKARTAACADIVDGLIFLVTSVVEAKEDKRTANGGIFMPLNLSEWLELRQGFVKDTLRSPPPPPLPLLGVEENSMLAVELTSMHSLEGGWKAPVLSPQFCIENPCVLKSDGTAGGARKVSSHGMKDDEHRKTGLNLFPDRTESCFMVMRELMEAIQSTNGRDGGVDFDDGNDMHIKRRAKPGQVVQVRPALPVESRRPSFGARLSVAVDISFQRNGGEGVSPRSKAEVALAAFAADAARGMGVAFSCPADALDAAAAAAVVAQVDDEGCNRGATACDVSDLSGEDAAKVIDATAALAELGKYVLELRASATDAHRTEVETRASAARGLAAELAAAVATTAMETVTTEPTLTYDGSTVKEAALVAGEAAASAVVAAVEAELVLNGGSLTVLYPDALVVQVIVQHLKQKLASVTGRHKCGARVPPPMNARDGLGVDLPVKQNIARAVSSSPNDEPAPELKIPPPLDYQAEAAKAAERRDAASLDSGTGWIVANFPINVLQGRLLEYLLAGTSAKPDSELDALIASAIASGAKAGKENAVVPKGVAAPADDEAAFGALLQDEPPYLHAHIDGILWLQLRSELQAVDSPPVPAIDVFDSGSQSLQIPPSDVVNDGGKEIEDCVINDSPESTEPATTEASEFKAWWGRFVSGTTGSTIELQPVAHDKPCSSRGTKAAIVTFGLASETIELALEAAGEHGANLETAAKSRLAERIAACMEYRDAAAAIEAINATRSKGEEKEAEPPVPALVSNPITVQHTSEYICNNLGRGGSAKAWPVSFLGNAELEARRLLRRKGLPVAGQIWQALRCGEYSMQARAIRGPIKDWTDSTHVYTDASRRACLETVKIERSIGEFVMLSRWNTACAVRSSSGDSCPHLVAVARENLLRGPAHLMAGGGVAEIEARRILVDNLECDLGDIASKRYRTSLEGIDVVRNQAAQWVLGVRNDASCAVASMAKNEVCRLTAGERLMRDYYSDEVKGLPPLVSCGQSSLQTVAYLKHLTRAFAVELDEAGLLETFGDGDGVSVESGLEFHETATGIMQKQRKAIAEAFGSALRAIEKGFGSERDGLDPGATALAVLRIHMCERLRGAVARAVGLHEKAKACVSNLEASLTDITRARTQAEHRSVANMAKQLREGGLLKSGAGLADNMAPYCLDGGPLQQCGDDLIDVPDPHRCAMDLCASRLDLKQCALLVACLADASKRQTSSQLWQKDKFLSDVPGTKGGKEGVVTSRARAKASDSTQLRNPDLLTIECFTAALAAFVNRSDPGISAIAMGVAQHQISVLPGIWSHKHLPAAVAFTFGALPSTTGEITTSEATLFNLFEQFAAGTLEPPPLPWRSLVHHLICTLVPVLPTTIELREMACHMRIRSSSVSPDGSSTSRVLISKTEVLDATFWFDEHAPSAISPSPAHPLHPSLSAAIKNLYVLAFEAGAFSALRGAVALDSMLLALAAHPEPPLASGFSRGLLRAAVVASELHPCSAQERAAYEGRINGILLSSNAIGLLLSTSPPGCGESPSVQAFMHGEGCMSFSELTRRDDVRGWCQSGWFVLRDLSRTLAFVRRNGS